MIRRGFLGRLLGFSAVALTGPDCVNPWPLTRAEWREVADRAGVPALEVEVVCSDPHEHGRRVEARTADIAGHRLPTWQEVIERDYRPWDGQPFVVDTAQLTIEEAVRAIVTRVRELRVSAE